MFFNIFVIHKDLLKYPPLKEIKKTQKSFPKIIHLFSLIIHQIFLIKKQNQQSKKCFSKKKTKK